jgi:hypothetical protein
MSLLVPDFGFSKDVGSFLAKLLLLSNKASTKRCNAEVVQAWW